MPPGNLPQRRGNGGAAGALALVAIVALVIWVFTNDGEAAPKPDPRTPTTSAEERSNESSADLAELDDRVVANDPVPDPVGIAALDATPEVTPGARTAPLRVVTVDSEGKPIEGAEVSIGQRTASGVFAFDRQFAKDRHAVADGVTGERGHVDFELPRGRPYLVRASAEGCGPRTAREAYAGQVVRLALDAPAVLAGEVRYQDDDQPVVGARVVVTLGDHSELESETDERGAFRTEGLPSGKLRVEVHPEAGQSWSGQVELEAGATHVENVEIARGPALVGKVLDAVTKAPIAGATIGANWTYDRWTTSDPRGAYRLDGYPRASYSGVVAVRADGYAPEQLMVDHVPLQDGVRTVDFELQPEVSTTGRVLQVGGAPIANAMVVVIRSCPAGPGVIGVDASSSRTDASGTWRSDRLRPGERYEVIAHADGFAQKVMCLAQGGVSGEVVRVPDIILDREAVLIGKLLVGGEPAEKVYVELEGHNADRWAWCTDQEQPARYYAGSADVRTDAQGIFRFSGLAPGTYKISATRPVEWKREITIDPGVIRDDLVIEVDAGAKITGRVLGPDGKPVKSWLDASPMESGSRDGHGAQTKDDGTFEITGCTKGALYTVTARTLGTSDAVTNTSIEARGGDTDVVVHMQAAAILAGKVLDPAGEPVSGAWVLGRPTNPPGQGGSARTNGDGTFRMAVPTGSVLDLRVMRPSTEDMHRLRDVELEAPDDAKAIAAPRDGLVLRVKE